MCCLFLIGPVSTVISTLSLHDALPISLRAHLPHRDDRRRLVLVGQVDHVQRRRQQERRDRHGAVRGPRSEEHTSELQSLRHLVCRLLLEKKKTRGTDSTLSTTTPN